MQMRGRCYARDLDLDALLRATRECNELLDVGVAAAAPLRAREDVARNCVSALGLLVEVMDASSVSLLQPLRESVSSVLFRTRTELFATAAQNQVAKLQRREVELKEWRARSADMNEKLQHMRGALNTAKAEESHWRKDIARLVEHVREMNLEERYVGDQMVRGDEHTQRLLRDLDAMESLQRGLEAELALEGQCEAELGQELIHVADEQIRLRVQKDKEEGDRGVSGVRVPQSVFANAETALGKNEEQLTRFAQLETSLANSMALKKLRFEQIQRKLEQASDMLKRRRAQVSALDRPENRVLTPRPDWADVFQEHMPCLETELASHPAYAEKVPHGRFVRHKKVGGVSTSSGIVGEHAAEGHAVGGDAEGRRPSRVQARSPRHRRRGASIIGESFTKATVAKMTMLLKTSGSKQAGALTVRGEVEEQLGNLRTMLETTRAAIKTAEQAIPPDSEYFGKAGGSKKRGLRKKGRGSRRNAGAHGDGEDGNGGDNGNDSCDEDDEDENEDDDSRDSESDDDEGKKRKIKKATQLLSAAKRMNFMSQKSNGAGIGESGMSLAESGGADASRDGALQGASSMLAKLRRGPSASSFSSGSSMAHLVQGMSKMSSLRGLHTLPAAHDQCEKEDESLGGAALTEKEAYNMFAAKAREAMIRNNKRNAANVGHMSLKMTLQNMVSAHTSMKQASSRRPPLARQPSLRGALGFRPLLARQSSLGGALGFVKQPSIRSALPSFLTAELEADSSSISPPSSSVKASHQSTEPLDLTKPMKVDASKFIICLGPDAAVPRFMRQRGRVRLRDIKKEELHNLINGYLDDRRSDLDSTETGLGDFMHTALKKQFGLQSILSEWGYNIVHQLQECSHSWATAQCILLVLSGKLSEEVLLTFMDGMCVDLHGFFKRVDVKRTSLALSCDNASHTADAVISEVEGSSRPVSASSTSSARSASSASTSGPWGPSGPSGKVMLCDIGKSLAAFLPSTSPSVVGALEQHLAVDAGMRQCFAYNKLFEDPCKSTFIQALLLESISCIQTFMESLVAAICRLPEKVATLKQVKGAILARERMLSSADVDVQIAKLLKCKPAALNWEQAVSTEIFASSFQRACLLLPPRKAVYDTDSNVQLAAGGSTNVQVSTASDSIVSAKRRFKKLGSMRKRMSTKSKAAAQRASSEHPQSTLFSLTEAFGLI